MDWNSIYMIMIFILGLSTGGIIVDIILIFYYKMEGILKIDHSNPDKDIYRIEIDDLDGLPNKKHVVLKIEDDADLSQK